LRINWTTEVLSFKKNNKNLFVCLLV
jgi:hypothetical protein